MSRRMFTILGYLIENVLVSSLFLGYMVYFS
jgi:hypothetical protein